MIFLLFGCILILSVKGFIKFLTEYQWQVFAPYGRVEDVYIMKDDLKQSRGV